MRYIVVKEITNGEGKVPVGNFFYNNISHIYNFL